MTTSNLRANFKWPQGEDLQIKLVYKEGNSAASAAPVALGSGYAVRMDIVVAGTSTPVYTFNSDDADVLTADEAILNSLTNGQPNIIIDLPRALTLPGGAIYEKMIAVPPVTTFSYDLFLRNTVTNKQVKILQGNISIEKSNTLWQ